MTSLTEMREAHLREMREYYSQVSKMKLGTSDGQEALRTYDRYKAWLGWLVFTDAHPVAIAGAIELLSRAKERLREILGSEEILKFFLES